MTRSLLAPIVLCLLALGCRTPVGVEQASQRDVHRTLTANVLTHGEPSPFTLALLDRNAWIEPWREDPEAALRQIHAGLSTPDLPEVYWRASLAALAELSFHRALETSSREWYRASAVYAYAFLFPDTAAELAHRRPFDPRIRLVVDLYNLGVAKGFERDGEMDFSDGSRSLPFGEIQLRMDPEERAWGGFRLTRLRPAAELRMWGLRNRHRRPGIGAPLAARIEPTDEVGALERKHVAPGVRVPVSALIRIEEPRRGLLAGRVEARAELYAADEKGEIEISGRRVVLEVEPTSALAWTLGESRVWEFERSGFFSGDFRIDAGPSFEGQLAMMHPYRPGRVPVVLVHGTASGPGRWAELINELSNDPVIGRRAQLWLFFYNSGNPIAYSGGLLAHTLRDLAEELDPEREDPALWNGVVIGHSQGGLLTKLTAVDSGRSFWDQVFKVGPDELDVDTETRDLLTDSLIFEPVPMVGRVVFISTPHGGSFLTSNPLSNLVAGLIQAPFRVMRGISDLIEQDPDELALRGLEGVPTSLDNMRPGNRFLETLKRLPVAPGIGVHSIIPVQGSGPLEKLDDGVVQYMSARIGQGSEKVIRYGHSVQAHPEAVAEVRRILRQHLRSLDAEEGVASAH
ncbi:MAG: alpha/beta fold hydrolase [Myxococcota bacterium]|nr:alpha/beta fold hydrolase [Myxococcota bacterium]